MLRAHALADLFTENLDDTTSAILYTLPFLFHFRCPFPHPR